LAVGQRADLVRNPSTLHRHGEDISPLVVLGVLETGVAHAFAPGSSLVHLDAPAAGVAAVESLDHIACRAGFFHLDESETPRLPRVAVLDDIDSFDGAMQPDGIFEVRLRTRERKVSDLNFRALSRVHFGSAGDPAET
jgi:hypothetical protein